MTADSPQPALTQGGQEKEEKQAEAQLWQQLAALRFKRTLRTLAVVQDLADAALAANDLRGGRAGLNRACIAPWAHAAHSTSIVADAVYDRVGKLVIVAQSACCRHVFCFPLLH